MLQNSVLKSKRTAKDQNRIFFPLFAMMCIFFYLYCVQKKRVE